MEKKITAGITAIGSYAPEKLLTNFDLEKMMDTNDEWIRSRTGIETRHMAADDEFASNIAIGSVEDLVKRFGKKAIEGVDLVILATSSPDALFPATASLVQSHFDLKAGAFDLLIACPGWIYGLSVAQAYVESGLLKKILVIGTEALTKLMDYSDRNTSILFGDGAGAAVVEAVEAGYGFKSFVLGSDGNGAKHLGIRATANKLPDGSSMPDGPFMNGREVFKFAVRIMPNATLDVLKKADMSLDDIDLFVPHQANSRIVTAAADKLGIDHEKMILVVNEYGNTSTASIPLALADAYDAGKVKKGDNLVFVSFGAGLSWAAMVLTWSTD